ncbi:MAG: DUF4249 domain-containing protein [Bacteroidota bacterium]
MKLKITYLIILVSLQSCVDRIELQSIASVQTLVVDASFNDLPGEQTVILSESFDLDEPLGSKVSGAVIWVEDEDGGRIDFEEAEVGTFRAGPEVKAEIGRKYRLHIELEGEKYESDWEEVPSPFPMDSLYARLLDVPSQNGGSEEGLQFFIDAAFQEEDVAYFRYAWKSAFKIMTPFVSPFEWDFEQDSLLLREQPLNICYSSRDGATRVITTTEGLTQNVISELPVHFVAGGSLSLRTEFALTIKQFSINANAFNYYKRLRENNESAGSFFDRQRGAINGNIQSVTNPDIPVLGYFEVASVAEIGEIFDPSRFAVNNILYPGCVPALDLDTVTFDELPEYMRIYRNLRLISNSIDVDLYLIVDKPCADCTNLGELEKPEWWIELEN